MQRRPTFRTLVVASLLVLLTGCSTTLRLRYRPALTSPTADPVAAFTIASGNDPAGGNTAEILENGDQIFPAMLDAIAGAESSIHM